MFSTENIISGALQLCQAAGLYVMMVRMRTKKTLEWLPLDVAIEQFGYAYKESLSRRLRQLRQRGYVIDIGRPPAAYPVSSSPQKGKINIMWPNPKTALIRSDTPLNLLHAKRIRRFQAGDK